MQFWLIVWNRKVKMRNWEFCIIVFQYIVITQAITCPPDNRTIRIFQSLDEYKNISGISEGSYVSFKVGRFPKLIKKIFIAKESHNIVGLNVSNKSINQIYGGAFLFLPCLYHLDLSNNNVTNLTTEVFLGLSNLKNLNISGNRLTYLYDYVFSNLENIKTIDVSYNKIRDMDRAVFFNITTLEKIVFSYNSMKTIRFLYFNELTYLRELYLDHNEIAVLSLKIFKKNLLLEKLDLSGNSLVIFGSKRDRTVLESINFLNLSDNYLINLNFSEVTYHFPNKNLTMDLNNNQFYCSDWREYLKELKYYHINIVPGRNFSKDYHINGMTCDTLNFTTDNNNNEEEELTQNILCGLMDKSVDHKITNTVPKKMPLLNQKNVTLDARDKDAGESSHSSIKAITIVLAVIGTAVFIFLALDYVLGRGFTLKITDRLRRFISPSGFDRNSDYITLQSPT